MTAPEFEMSAFHRRPGGIEAQLSAWIDEHIERVWAALTESEGLAQWLAPGSIEPRLGGAVKLDFGDSGIVIDSVVTAFKPKRLLEYSWSSPGQPARPLRWTLEPTGPMTRLSLSLLVPTGEDVARAFAGWAAHLDMLIAALAGIPTKFPIEVFKAARQTYQAQLLAPMTPHAPAPDDLVA